MQDKAFSLNLVLKYLMSSYICELEQAEPI